MTQRAPALLVGLMISLFLTTAAGIFIGLWYGPALIVSIATGLAFISCAMWIVFRLPRNRPSGWQAEQFRRTRSCPTCGYSRAGIQGSRCPECGYEFAAEQD